MIRLTTLGRNIEAEATGVALRGGKLQLLAGQRGAPNAAVLAEQNIVAATPPVDGAITLRLGEPATIVRTGVATWFRLLRADGSIVLDGSAGGKGSDLVLSDERLQDGGLFGAVDLVYTRTA